ncbi:MAG: glycosyltransferase family 2 protein [Candidatus Glassbacteria bacterium]|nr:glycosyltransferase family 2 protein [Candidatus Glassbacteria bacterium]
MSQNRPYLSLVIPSYNEEPRIGETLQGIIDYCRERSYEVEILVVDDGSTDDTKRVAESYGGRRVPLEVISYEPNRGKGYAVKTGMLAARGEYVLFADADMSTPIEMLERFEPLMQAGEDVIIGTRKVAQATVVRHQPFYRENMGKVFTWLSNVILGLNVSDFTCGFKCFSRRAVEQVFGRQTIWGWGYDTEIIYLASSLGYVVREVPVVWYNDEATRVKLWKHVFTSLGELIRIWQNSRKGFYSS